MPKKTNYNKPLKGQPSQTPRVTPEAPRSVPAGRPLPSMPSGKPVR